MEGRVKYAVITPARDEEEHIESTIRSVCAQTILPEQWVIVDDGSTDRTGEIIDRWAGRFPWIEAIHRPNRGFRKAGGGVVEAFYDGYQRLRSEWDVIVKLDGDLSLPPDYFEKCFAHFAAEPTLGIGGGVICHEADGRLKVESHPMFHVRGATKIYRRTCWEDIGGYWRGPGWDLIDEIRANMMGWKTRSFAELRLLHHRVTGGADGFWKDRMKYGVVCYVAGYHPLFVFASCVRRLFKKPYLVGSVAAACGFIKSHFSGVVRVADPEFLAYVRGQQLRRLFGLQTIWK